MVPQEEPQQQKEKNKRGSEIAQREKERDEGLFQCAGRVKRGKGRRCEVGVSKEGEFCRTHEYQRPHTPSKD